MESKESGADPLCLPYSEWATSCADSNDIHGQLPQVVQLVALHAVQPEPFELEN
jgi:hypothetical protein